MKLKHLYFAFTAMMLCFATPAFAQNLAGEGTEANPYQIGSLNDLITFRNSVNNGETKYNADGVYVALTANIDMASENWSVNIGDDCNNTFDGIFDGKGYTLYNLTSTETAAKGDEYICTGLFAAIAGNAVIKNVTIENVNIATSFEGYKGNNVSAVVGFAWAATGSIENVTVKGNISINAPNATGVGAILGYAYGSSSLTIKNCTVSATSGNILGAAYVGGIIGYAFSKNVINNNTVDNVTVEGVSVAGVAGIMLGGSSADANTVKNVSLKIAEDHKELWTNSAAIVAGTITGGYVTVSNTNYENVKADGKATDVIVGGILVEKPTSPIAAVEICVGDKYYSTNKLQGAGTEANPYKISSLAELILFRNSVNKGEETYNAEGVYVALTADIDLASVENWEPIGTFDYSFDGNFNGNGKVIKNLKMSSNAAANAEAYLGFFGVTANNVIENLTIENVTVTTEGQIVSAAIGYPYYTTVNNVKVCGNIAIEGGNYTAGVLGYTRLCVNASNLTVEGAEGSYIKGARVVGGVIADIQMNHGLKANYSNFSASGVAIEGTNMVGGISGILTTQTLNGATVKNVKLTSGDGRVGVVAGCFGGTCTLTDVVYENVDGATAIIGPTYKENKAVEARIGDTYYSSLDAALDAVQNGETITLINDIVLGSAVKIEAGKVVTLDLAGKTVSGVCNTNQQALVCVENNASLTVKDTAGEGKITFAQGASNVGWTVDVKGNFTLESGKIELTGSWSIGYAVEVRPNSWGTEYQNASIFTMNGGAIVSSDGGVRVASSSAAGHKNVAASFVMNGGKIDAAWDGVFVQQSNEIYDVLNFTINDGTIESDLNPVRVYGPAATGYVNGKECMNITFNGGTMSYTGTEAREWIIDGILRVDGGSTLETILESGSINASAEFAENNELPEGYEWVETENGIYTIESNTLVIDDREGKPFVNPTEKELTKLTYIRQFSSNTARDLFVPFEIPVEKLTAAGYEVYYINDVHSYDDNKDGEIDRMVMENIKMTGDILKANHPYIIRRLESTEEETLTLTLENVKLYSSNSDYFTTVDCSSAYVNFDVNGTYSPMSVEDLNRRLVVGSGKWGTLAEGYTLKPYRLHLTITTKKGSPVKVSEQAMKSISMSTVGEQLEDGTTVIYDVQMENNAPEGIYDLQGRRVVEPKKGGLYIVNGKKVIF